MLKGQKKKKLYSYTLNLNVFISFYNTSLKNYLVAKNKSSFISASGKKGRKHFHSTVTFARMQVARVQRQPRCRLGSYDVVTEVLRWNQIIASSRMKEADSDESEINISKPMRCSHVCSNQIRMQLSHKLATLVVVPI